MEFSINLKMGVTGETTLKKRKWTRLIMVDSQAVKNICNADVESKGFCSYKATNGIRRHLAVDTLGKEASVGFLAEGAVAAEIGEVHFATEEQNRHQ